MNHCHGDNLLFPSFLSFLFKRKWKKKKKKKNYSELLFFHESIRKIVERRKMTRVSPRSQFLWNIFRKHSKLGDVFPGKFHGNDHNFRSLRTPATTSFEQLRSFAELCRDFDTSFKYWIASARRELIYLSIDAYIDPPLIGTIFERKPRSSFASTIVRRFEIYPSIDSSFNADVEKTQDKCWSFCTLRVEQNVVYDSMYRRLKTRSFLAWNPDQEWTILFSSDEWKHGWSSRDKKDKRGRIRSRGMEKRAWINPRIRSLRIAGVNSPPNSSPSL